jgi:hypothetical protein
MTILLSRGTESGRFTSRPLTRRDVWCLAALAAIATVFFASVLFGGSNFYHRDLFLYHFPMKHIVREAMLSGEFPFWNRHFSGGQPLAANPAYELFYPLQWLILAGSYPFGFALHIVVHVYLALVGMYLLLRELPLGRPASFFGSLSFGMGGMLLGTLPMLPTFFVWALAPLVGWSILRALREPSASRLAAAALLAGVQLTIAEPIAILQVWLLFLAGALLVIRFRRAMAILFMIGVASLAVGAAQIFPAVDHAHDSIRSKGIPYENVKQFAMPAARPLELAIPQLYGRYEPLKGKYWGASSFDRGTPYVTSLYAGIAVLILALAGLLVRARGWLTVLVISALSYVLAVGDQTPLLRALYDAGVARGLRYPEKFALMAIVVLTIFSASIAERLLGGDEHVRRAAILASGIVTLLSLGPLLWSLTPGFSPAFMQLWQLRPSQLGLPAFARSMWLTGFVVTALMALLFIVHAGMEKRRWLTFALALVSFDLLFIDSGIVTRMPGNYFTEPPVTARFDADRDAYSLLNRGEWLHSTLNYRALRGYLGPWFARNGMQPYTPAAWGFRSALEADYDETALLPTHALLDAMMAAGDSGLTSWAESFAAISNVRYLVDYMPVQQIARSADPGEAQPVRLTRIPNTGTYYFAEEVSVADPVTFMKGPGIHRPIAFVATPLTLAGHGRLVRAAERANGATLEVECSGGAALLVATVTRHKYWRATIDGKTARLLPANLAYQALVVPAGHHKIEMHYRNPLVAGSVVISALAVLLCGMLVGRGLILPARA